MKNYKKIIWNSNGTCDTLEKKLFFLLNVFPFFSQLCNHYLHELFLYTIFTIIYNVKAESELYRKIKANLYIMTKIRYSTTNYSINIYG